MRLYQGPDFTPAGGIALGDDADNIRIEPGRNRIVVGYGKGGLAIIDPASRKKVADIPLKITGTYVNPTVRPDAQALAKGELKQKLRDVLKKNGLEGLFGK